MRSSGLRRSGVLADDDCHAGQRFEFFERVGMAVIADPVRRAVPLRTFTNNDIEVAFLGQRIGVGSEEDFEAGAER